VRVQELSSKPDVEYIPGGATQNSVRVAQWVMRTPGSTAYFGCIGSDEYGKIMRDSASRDGVDVRRFFCAFGSILHSVATPVAASTAQLIHNEFTFWMCFVLDAPVVPLTCELRVLAEGRQCARRPVTRWMTLLRPAPAPSPSWAANAR